MIWIQHPDLRNEDGSPRCQQVAPEALGILGASGWVALDDAEVAALEERQRAEKAARYAALGGEVPPAPKSRGRKSAPQENKEGE